MLGDDFMLDCNFCLLKDGCSKDKGSCMIENNLLNNVKKIIGVMSGKGGVGKFLILVIIVKYLKGFGYSVGILDVDIIGLSVLRFFGVENKKVMFVENMMYLVIISEGIKVMFLNLLVENEENFVFWRGLIILGMVK